MDARIGRFTEAIQLGDALGPLVADLKTLTTRREHLLVRLNGGAGERRVQIANLRALEVELRGYLASGPICSTSTPSRLARCSGRPHPRASARGRCGARIPL